MMLTKKVLYSGNVQGVGFRYQCCQIAKAYPVVGSVANLADGRVEIYVQGNEPAVCAFLDHVEQQLGCYIQLSTQTKLTESLEANVFTIVYY